MTVEVKKFQCSICKKLYDDADNAVACEESCDMKRTEKELKKRGKYV